MQLTYRYRIKDKHATRLRAQARAVNITRGRWYINCPVEIAEATQAPLKYVGIDLGLKDFATLSTGEKIAAPRFYRKSEAALASVQRRRKSKRAKAFAANIANRRKDFLHKASSKIAKEYGLVVVGDVRVRRSSLRPTWQRAHSMPVGRASRTCCR